MRRVSPKNPQYQSLTLAASRRRAIHMSGRQKLLLREFDPIGRRDEIGMIRELE
jgi:hypothetical protein